MLNNIKLALSWIVWPLTYGVMFLLSFFTKVKTYYEDENFLSIKRPLIIVSNHRTIFDPWYVSFAIPFKILFGRIFPLRPYSSVHLSEKNKMGRILKTLGIMDLTYLIYNTITFPKDALFEDKIAPLVKVIRNKQSVMIFPEGRMTFDDSILNFKKGVISVHQLTGAQILPVAIRYDKSGFFSKVYVAIGKPLTIPQDLLQTDKINEFQNASDYLREKILSLYEKTK